MPTKKSKQEKPFPKTLKGQENRLREVQYEQDLLDLFHCQHGYAALNVDDTIEAKVKVLKEKWHMNEYDIIKQTWRGQIEVDGEPRDCPSFDAHKKRVMGIIRKLEAANL